MRANKSKFKKNQAVAVRNWTGKNTESGIVTAVIGIPVGEQMTMYRYMVLMDNARGAFGKSQRFVFEHEIVNAVTVTTAKAA